MGIFDTDKNENVTRTTKKNVRFQNNVYAVKKNRKKMTRSIITSITTIIEFQ